jgi:hypothetical protein
MSRRRQRSRDDIAFGSDSFLDVVCNVVGILVILTVLVGLRVRSSSSATDSAAAEELATMDARIAQTRADLERRTHELTDHVRRERQVREEHLRGLERRRREIAEVEAENERRRVARVESELARSLEVARRRQVLEEHASAQREEEERAAEHSRKVADANDLNAVRRREAAELTARLAGLTAEIAGAERILEERRRIRENREAEVSALEATVARTNEEERKAAAALADVAGSTEELDGRILRLRDEIRQLEESRPEGEPWLHFAVPLSRRVNGREFHYRLLGGRLVEVPVDELLGLVGPDFQRQDARQRSVVEGMVGPVRRFRVRYRLSRSNKPSLALVEQGIHFRFDRAEFIPGADLQEETLPEIAELPASPSDLRATGPLPATFQSLLAEEARRAKLRGTKRADPDAAVPPAVTLWVYPDSFKAAKWLQIGLHARGFPVALRPMPFGSNISASEDGEASRVQ